MVSEHETDLCEEQVNRLTEKISLKESRRLTKPAALMSHLRYVVNHDYADQSIDYMMDIVEQVMREDPAITPEYVRSLRITADHCSFYPRPSQLPRMKNLGMIISCDAMFLDQCSPWLKVYGLDKASRIALIKTMLANGVMPTAEAELGRVETGESETLHAQLVHLITRKNDSGESPAPEEAIDRQTLMKMSTSEQLHTRRRKCPSHRSAVTHLSRASQCQTSAASADGIEPGFGMADARS